MIEENLMIIFKINFQNFQIKKKRNLPMKDVRKFDRNFEFVFLIEITFELVYIQVLYSRKKSIINHLCLLEILMPPVKVEFFQ